MQYMECLIHIRGKYHDLERLKEFVYIDDPEELTEDVFWYNNVLPIPDEITPTIRNNYGNDNITLLTHWVEYKWGAFPPRSIKLIQESIYEPVIYALESEIGKNLECPYWPRGIITKLSQDFPDCVFTVDYFNNTKTGGTVIIENGHHTHLETSHCEPLFSPDFFSKTLREDEIEFDKILKSSGFER